MAYTSTISPVIPQEGTPLSAAAMRGQFGAAITDVNALGLAIAGIGAGGTTGLATEISRATAAEADLAGSIATATTVANGAVTTANGAVTTAGTAAAAASAAGTVAAAANVLAAAALPKAGGTMTGELVLNSITLASTLASTPKSYVDAAIATVNTAVSATSTVANNALAKAGGTMTGIIRLTGSGNDTITVANQAVTKAYADLMLPLGGGTMTGGLTLFANPTALLGAATKQYVDAVVGAAGALPTAGGTMTGELVLNGATTFSSGNVAVSKTYADKMLPLAGGTVSGPVILTGSISSFTITNGAIPKGYADLMLPLGGGTMTGGLTLFANPTALLGAATKQYVDAVVGAAGALPTAGGTMSGALVLANAAPVATNEAAAKGYVDTQTALRLPLAGGTMGGGLTLAGTPTAINGAATKGYVDAVATSAAGAVPLAGGTMTGGLTLSGTPTAANGAANKGYVDTIAATLLPLAGGTVSGTLSLGALITTLSSGTQAATKGYADLMLPLAGGTVAGPLLLNAGIAFSNQAIPKSYADLMLPLAGGTITGPVQMTAVPSAGTISGTLSLAAAITTASSATQAATKGYVDTASVPIGGGTMGGLLLLAGDPISANGATTKVYTDKAAAGAEPAQIAALGTTQATAAPINSRSAIITSAAATTRGVVLVEPPVSPHCEILNTTAQDVQLFPATGTNLWLSGIGFIGVGKTAVSVTIPAGGPAILKHVAAPVAQPATPTWFVFIS